MKYTKIEYYISDTNCHYASLDNVIVAMWANNRWIDTGLYRPVRQIYKPHAWTGPHYNPSTTLLNQEEWQIVKATGIEHTHIKKVYWCYNKTQDYYHPFPLAGKRAHKFIIQHNHDSNDTWELHTPTQYDQWNKQSGKSPPQECAKYHNLIEHYKRLLKY